MAVELGRFIAARYSDPKSLAEVLKKVPQRILMKVGESAGDRFLEKGDLDCAFEAYMLSGNYSKLLAVGDKALEEGRIQLAVECYKRLGKDIDSVRKDVLDFLLNVVLK